MDRLASMAAFVRAADLGSFTAAASALGMSPQMVGKHVSTLEARLGAQLLHRTTRRQSLTSVGQTFHERCRAILADAEAAETMVQELATTPRGRLRVNAPVAFGAACLAPLVTRYLDAHPAVEVELTLTDRTVDIVEEGYDATVRLGRLRDSGLTARALAPHRLIACASPSYLARRGTPATPEELSGHECLHYVNSSGFPQSEWTFSRGGLVQTVAVRGRLQINDGRLLHAAARSGRGIILQAAAVVADDLASGALVRVLPDHDGPTRPMHLLFSSARRPTPKLRRFIDLVVERFGPSARRSPEDVPVGR